MKKELGGDRIGSGNKMDVSMHGYERSTHNMTRITRTTQSIGTIVPVYTQIGLPGDTWELDLDMLIRTRPTEGPLFGSMNVEMHVYKWDIRLGIAKLHMNLLDTGMDVSEIKFPQIVMEADKINWNKNPDNQQINPSCLYSYLGIRGLGDTQEAGQNPERYFNALKILMYWNIVKNYYANKQEALGAVIHGKDLTRTVTSFAIINGGTEYGVGKAPANYNVPISRSSEARLYYTTGDVMPQVDEIVITIDGNNINLNDVFREKETIVEPVSSYILLSGTGQNGTVSQWDYAEAIGARPPKIVTFPLKNIDEMNLDILADVKNASAFEITNGSIEPYNLPLKKYGNLYSKLTNQEGLAVKTYKSDKFNNWLDTEWIESINSRSAVNTAGGSFTIDALILKRKTYDYLNRILVAGGTIDDWQEVTYDQKRYSKPEIPVYEGGLSRELIFEEVISNSASSEQPLGTLGGRGKLGGGRQGGKVNIKCDETCYIMVLASITPRIDYSQGNEWDGNLETLEDLHKPEFDQIGFQDSITDERAFWDSKQNVSGGWIYKSAGKVPAWLDYMTSYDVNLGNFAEQDQEMFMVLNRRYEWNKDGTGIKDLTTYIDPVKFNHIWAYKALDAQNIWAQYGVKAKARRKMSAALMPRL